MLRSASRLLLLLLIASACGKRGDPSPPFPRGPVGAKDLAAEQQGGDVVLTFSYPDRLMSGEPLSDLEAVEVWRVADASPALAEPPAPVSAQSTDRLPGYTARRSATNLRLREEQFYEQARRQGRLEGAELARATRGSTLVFRDPLARILEGAQRPARLAYAVVSIRRGGERSPLSNIVLIAPEVPPAAPEITLALSEEGRVCLEWTAPEKDLMGEPAKVGGYFVYRRALPEEEYAAPLHAEPISETFFVDAGAPYADLVYTVRATVPEKPAIEGAPAREAPVVHRDVFPPAPPARLDALPEEGGVRLVWDPSPAADLAGYVVYRAEGAGNLEAITPEPIAEALHTDRAILPGRRYRWVVRAMDRAGNLGAASPEAAAEAFRAAD